MINVIHIFFYSMDYTKMEAAAAVGLEEAALLFEHVKYYIENKGEK